MDHRIFFAVLPPPEIADLLVAEREDAERALGIGSKPMRQERLHITTFLFDDAPDFPAALVDRCVEVAALLDAAPFRVTFDRLIGGAASIMAMPEERLRGYDALQGRLAIALSASGLRARKDWRFNPHVTLAHRPSAAFERMIDPISWTVAELVLLDSWVGCTHYEELGRWTLKDEGNSG